MSAVPGATAGLRPPSSTGLRWAAGHLSFELATPDPAVLDRARVVFGPWLNDCALPGGRCVRFVVESQGESTGRRWRVVRSGDAEATIAASIDLALAAVEYRAVAEFADPDSPVVSLHAALLSRAGHGLLLVGRKEAGKSTLAAALMGAGWRLHSDDMALIEKGTRARGIPRRVSLRNPSRQLLGAETWERLLRLPGTLRTRTGMLFHPAEAWPANAPVSVPVDAAILLARRGAAVGCGVLEPLDAGRALLALAPYCNRREAGIHRALEALQPMVDRIRAFDLGRGDLATMVRRVEEVMEP